MRDTLHDEGFVTAEASEGGEGLAWLREHDASLILLDWNMAPVDGPAFMAEFVHLERARATPVVLLTADSRISSRTTHVGFAAVLKKPIDLQQLFDLARRYCGDPHAR